MIKKVQIKLKYQTDFQEFDINTIELDSILPYSLYIKKKDDYVIIIEAGTCIDSKVLAALKKQESIYLEKDDLTKQSLVCGNLQTYLSYSKDNPQYCVDLFYKVNKQFCEAFLHSPNNKFDIKDVEAIVGSIIQMLEYNEHFVKENMTYFKNDNMLAHHSLHVAIYAVYLGKTLGLKQQALMDLGIAGYVQDFGLKIIDKNIANKDTPLSDEELTDIKKHPMHSVQIAKHNHIHSPYIIDAIKHHHENQDGSGYPDGLKKDDISMHTAILSICDVFDALTSHRAYREAMSSFEALTFMMKDINMMNRFNNQYIVTFIKLLVSK